MALAISVDPTIVVQAPAHVPLPISVSGGGGVPPKSFLHLSGLPPAVGLTAGRVIGPGEWVVPPSALQNLAMNVPANVSGTFQIVITLLVGGERTQILTAHARAMLVVASAVPIETVPSRAPTKHDPDDRAGASQARPPETERPTASRHERDPDADGDRPTSGPAFPAAKSGSELAGITSRAEDKGAAVAAAVPAPGANSPEPHGERTPPQVPTPTPEERARAEKSLTRGERDLQDGNIALARLSFRRAAEAGIARAAFLLAATYDPRELASLGAVGVQPDPALARRWYERAHLLGEPEAKGRLARLADN
jgi:hypothetical protein